MGTHLKQMFADLDKDPDSRRRSMNSLRNYVQQLDSKAIPQCIAQLSELQDGHLPRQYLIYLYEVIAREHGKSIIPEITKMMGDVLKALSSNASSLALQQACAKAVSAMARYTIGPSSFQGQREGVIRDLANPLLDVLLGTVQSLAEGAAMCLQALVETEAWKYAPDDIVNEICLRVTGALEEKGTQTNSHIKLVCSLVKSNSPILEAYGRSLLKAAAKILEAGVVTGNSQQRLHAVLMINGLLKSVDMDILASEIPNTVMYLERCRSDRTPSVRNTVSETIQLAKALASETGIDLNNDGSYGDEEIPCGGNTSSSGSLCGFNDFSPDMQIGPYTQSPVSSMQSLNTKYQIPSITGSGTRAKRFSNFDLSRGYYSDSIDKNAFSEKMRNPSFSPLSDRSESTRLNAGKNMATEQTPHCFFTHTGKDGDFRRYLVPESHLFDEGGNGSISLENGIIFGSDTEVVAEYESDGASERKYSCEHGNRQRRTRIHMVDRHGENGDASVYDGDCFERRHSYKEDENDPCFSFRGNYSHSHCPSAVEETVSPKNPGSYIAIDDMSVFNTPSSFVRSLEQQSSSKNTCRKLQSRGEFADCAESNHDNLNEIDWTMNLSPAANGAVNESRGGDHRQMITAKKGRTMLDSLYSVADGYSVRSNSEEGDLQNSSEWSESVHRTDSLSPASSTVFEEMLDNEEDYQSTGLSELDKEAYRTENKKENCLPANLDSVEGSTDSCKWQETKTFCTCWRRALCFMESILGVSLCAVLAVPATMVAVKLFSRQEEYHVMVPT